MNSKTLKYFFQIAIFGVCLALVYQNCGQQEANVDGPSETGPIANKVSMGDSDLTRAVDLFIDQTWVVMDMTTTRVLQADDLPELKDLCLNDEAAKEWDELVVQNSLCQFKHNVPKDLMCTMVYTFPYLKVPIKGQKDKMPVGEKANGCPEKTIEFCENTREVEEFLTSLQADTDFSPCP